MEELIIRADIILDRLSEYFEGKMDADHDGERFVPNEEMKLSLQIEDLQLILKQIKKEVKWTSNLTMRKS